MLLASILETLFSGISASEMHFRNLNSSLDKINLVSICGVTQMCEKSITAELLSSNVFITVNIIFYNCS